MQEVKIAGIAVENVAYHFDKLYDYIIPDGLSEEVQPGCRVMVPFGRGSVKRQGVVFSVSNGSKDSRMKLVSSVLDKAPLVSGEMLDLALWLKEHVFCTLFEAVKVTMPSGINLKTTVSYIALDDISPQKVEKLQSDEKQVLEYLINKRIYIARQKLLRDLGLESDSDIPERLFKLGLIARNIDAKQKVNDAAVRMVRLSDSAFTLENMPKLTKKQNAVLTVLKDTGSASVKEICYFTGVTPAVVSALNNKGITEYFDKEVYRKPYSNQTIKNNGRISLTDEQETAFENLFSQYQKGKYGVSLLYGITGSGKTQLFMCMIDEVLKSGRGVIVMVPEIALTPQTLHVFHSRYGDNVAVFHSSLSVGERADEWKRVKNGQAKIVVGTRSAVFAPFDDIGLIILDEEQESTYKSESSPRYHAREVAKFRCARNNALLILASATPSFESFTQAKQGGYSLNVLKNRYGNAVLPKVITVDMCKERADGNRTEISRALHEALYDNMQKGHQSILLINRRGYNTFVACNGCGHVVTCPSCSISMTYHSANGRLMCHYCGYSEPFTDTCKECGEKDVRYSGIGTQKVEEELSALLPEARILRMDTDSTMSRFSHEKKLSEFADGNYDIMIGTQMVAKGLDFENVTLVGVLSADQQLYNDDYKSMERTFGLLTQVVGRSGRGEFEGRAVIQTIAPENEVIKLAARQDYEAFYETEMKIRKAMIYPPYCDICSIGFLGENENQVRAASKLFLETLKLKSSAEYQDLKLIVLGPMPMRISKVSNKYRYRLIIKVKNSKKFRAMISEILIQFGKDSKFNPVTIFADMNPESIF